MFTICFKATCVVFLSGFQITSPGEYGPDCTGCWWCSVAQFQSPANYSQGFEEVNFCNDAFISILNLKMNSPDMAEFCPDFFEGQLVI